MAATYVFPTRSNSPRAVGFWPNTWVETRRVSSPRVCCGLRQIHSHEPFWLGVRTYQLDAAPYFRLVLLFCPTRHDSALLPIAGRRLDDSQRWAHAEPVLCVFGFRWFFPDFFGQRGSRQIAWLQGQSWSVEPGSLSGAALCRSADVSFIFGAFAKRTPTSPEPEARARARGKVQPGFASTARSSAAAAPRGESCVSSRAARAQAFARPE